MRERMPRNPYAAFVLFLSAVLLPFASDRSVVMDRDPVDGEPATLYAAREPLNPIQASPDGGAESYVASYPPEASSRGE